MPSINGSNGEVQCTYADGWHLALIDQQRRMQAMRRDAVTSEGKRQSRLTSNCLRPDWRERLTGPFKLRQRKPVELTGSDDEHS